MHEARRDRNRWTTILVVGGLVSIALALVASLVAFALASATTSAEQNTFTAAAVDHITVSPASASITAGGSQLYAATAFDASNHSFGVVTASTSFALTPDGSCTGNSC